MPPRGPGSEGRSPESADDRSERIAERRTGERRRAGESIDVSRIEHENLAKQVDHNTHTLRRLDAEVRRLQERLDRLTNPRQKQTG